MTGVGAPSRPPGGRAIAPSTGVVLAAGRSERLSRVTRGRSKALQRLGGVPLVLRSIRSLLAAGLDRVIVVVGHDGDRVASAALAADDRVEVVRAPSWELGNGASLSAAEPMLQPEELFVLLCGDHLFAPGALDELVGTSSAAVLVDPAPAPDVWSEGTRVRAVDGHATAFGKDLDEAAIDCGAFVLSSGVFAALRDGAAEGDHSLAGAVTRLANAGPVEVVPLRPGTWWRDVDTPADLRAARKLLRRSLAKETDGLVSRRLNRPISTRVTMAIAPLHLPPTLISAFTFVLGVWGAWSLSGSRPLMGGLLVQAASILDGTDGETARLLGKASRRGAFVDGLFDRMVDAAIIAGLWLWAWDDPSQVFRIVGIIVSAVGWGVVAMALKEPTAVFEVPKSEEPVFSALFGGRDVRMLILAIGSLANLPVVAFYVGMGMYLVSMASRVLRVLRRQRLRAESGAAAGVGAERPVVIPEAGTVAAPALSARASILRVARILLFPAIVVAVFIGVVPNIADLSQVWDVVSSLSWRMHAVLALLAAWNLATYWPMLVAAMPGLTLTQAAVVGESSTAVAMTVPAGGAVAVGVSYAMYSSWGFSRAAIANSTLATFVANMSLKLLLPAVSLVALAVVGEPTAGLVVGALVAVGVFLAGFAGFVLLLRDERVARRIGLVAGSVVSFARGLARRRPVARWDERAAAFRAQLVDLLRKRWLPLSVTELVSQISVFLVLFASLRFVGVSNDQVSWAQALTVFAFVRLASAVPIVPGNVGLAELGYIGGLVVAGGGRAQVVAAVLLFRFLTYFVQIPIGGITYLVWKQRRRWRAPAIGSAMHEAEVPRGAAVGLAPGYLTLGDSPEGDLQDLDA